MGQVVITGAAALSPIGNNVGNILSAIESGKKGIDYIKSFNTDYFPSSLGAEVKSEYINISGNSYKDKKEIFINRVMEELFNRFKWIENYPPQNRVLNIGAGLDYFNLPDYAISEDASKDRWQTYSNDTIKIIEKLASRFNVKGGFLVNVTACVASTQAMGLSYRMLKESEKNKILLTGGFDSMLNPLHYMGFYKLGALSTEKKLPGEACRPFDKNRCGLVLGEGAIVFLLQNSKGADPQNILAEIVGYSSTMDAYRVTDPEPNGKCLAQAAINAIHESGILPDDIDCVHLHGTGTIKNGIAEANAMKLIFQNRYKEVPVFSLKGQTGHLISACGAMEMLGVIYSIQKQTVPVTVNFEKADPKVPLRVIKNNPLNINIKYVLKLNAAFGGQNTAFVVKKYGK